MRILLTGGTDVYGHSLIFLFLRDGATSESTPSMVIGDRAFFHAQLRPCLNILMSNTRCSGISIVSDFRDVGSVEHLNAIVSSLVICQNELCSNIAICYFVEPSSRQLRRALCRFVKCGSEESNKNSSAFKIPFQVLLFSGTKGLKDHIKSHMLPEEFGGSLLFDEVSYLLQIAVFDTLSKLKTSIAAMHSFIESASSGDVLDGDVSACLEQFCQLREQAFGLYSHLKNAGFDRFDPFPIFRKLFAEGDALHSLATQMRALLMERQHKLNAFSTLCSKLGEGERILRALEIVLNSPESYPSLLKEPNFVNDDSILQIDQFFTPKTGSDVMAHFLSDFHHLLETALFLNEDPLGSQLKAGFDLDAISQQIDRVESLYSSSPTDRIMHPSVQKDEKPVATSGTTTKPVTEPLELTCTSSNSPCPLSSSSLSQNHSDSTGPSSNNKLSAATPSFSEVSPVGVLENHSPSAAPDIELDDASCKSASVDVSTVSVSIQTENCEPLSPRKAIETVEKHEDEGKLSLKPTEEKKQLSSQSRTCPLEMKSWKTNVYEKIVIPPNQIVTSIRELTQLISRFESRAAELRQSHSPKIIVSHPSLIEMKALLAKLSTAAKRMHEQSKNSAKISDLTNH